MKTINARQVMTLSLQLQGRHSRLDVEQDVFTWIPRGRAQKQIDVAVEQPTPKDFDGQGVWANQFLDETFNYHRNQFHPSIARIPAQ
jgi:hypothetical protein